MTQPHIVEDCGVCKSIHGADRKPDEIVYENDVWHIRHGGAPYGVAGWMMLVTKSHAPGPWGFDETQIKSLGPTLAHVTRKMIEVTGALRIYTAWMGESWPHFHAHLVPRYTTMPKDAKAWGVFDLQRAAGAGEVTVDLTAVTEATAKLRAALAGEPPPAL